MEWMPVSPYYLRTLGGEALSFVCHGLTASRRVPLSAPSDVSSGGLAREDFTTKHTKVTKLREEKNLSSGRSKAFSNTKTSHSYGCCRQELVAAWASVIQKIQRNPQELAGYHPPYI